MLGKPDLEAKLRLVLSTAAVAAAAFLYATTTFASKNVPWMRCNSHLAPRAELRCAQQNRYHALGKIIWARHQARHVQLLAFTALTTLRLNTILRNNRWLYKAETARIAEAKARIAASEWPVHHSLWLCIHSSEGAWDDPNSGNNGHYGGLQMHPGWGYGTAYYANNSTQLVQEQSAERAYRASNYSATWLRGQWGQTIGPCWQYA